MEVYGSCKFICRDVACYVSTGYERRLTVGRHTGRPLQVLETDLGQTDAQIDDRDLLE